MIYSAVCKFFLHATCLNLSYSD